MSYYRDFVEDLNQFEKDSFPYSLIPGSTTRNYLDLLELTYGDIRQQDLKTQIVKNHGAMAFQATVAWDKEGSGDLLVAACGHHHPTKLQNKRTASRHVSVTSAENCAKAMVAQIRNLIPPNGWMGLQEGVMPPHYTGEFRNYDDYRYGYEPSTRLHNKIKDAYTHDTTYTEAINKYATYWTDEVQKLFTTEEYSKDQIQYHIAPVMIDGRRLFIVIDQDGEPVTDPVAHRGEVFALCRDLNEKENS